MKKFECKKCESGCKLEIDEEIPNPTHCIYNGYGKWQEVKEEEKAEELPSWCKKGEMAYYTKGELYCEILEVDKKRGLILFNSEYLITDFVSISELAEARLRPFNESEMRELVGKAITSKITETSYLIVRSDPYCVSAAGDLYCNERLLELFTFTNGQPCGVYEHKENGEWVE